MKSLNFTKQFQNSLLGKLFFLGLLMTSSILSAQVFNVNFAPLNFSANNQSVITGTLNAANSQVLYTNVITLNNQRIDCIVTNVNSTSTFDRDWRSNPNVAPGNTTDALRVDSMFSPIVPNTFNVQMNNFNFRFVITTVDSNNPNDSTFSDVILDNVVMNVYDMDRDATNQGYERNRVIIGTNNFTTFEAISTRVEYNNLNSTELDFFQGGAASSLGSTNYATIITDANRYRFTFSNLTNLNIQLGTEGIKNNGTATAEFFLAFSRGTGFNSQIVNNNLIVDLNTNDPSVNNTVEIDDNNAYNFTLGNQNVLLFDPQNLSTTINGLNVTYPTAHIINDNYERLIIDGVTGGNIDINLTSPTTISSFTLNSITYTMTVTTNSGVVTLRFTNANSSQLTLAQAETLIDALQYKNNSIVGDEIGFRNFTVTTTGTYILSSITYNIVSPPAIFIAHIYVPLPVKIARFVGKAVAQTNVLEWDVTEEYNFSHYEIYRSGNGAEYFPLGKIYATGDFNGFKKYAFVDNNPLASINYYKLKLVDHDGNATWSNSIFVNRSINLTNQVTLFPNPTHAVINVNLLDIELNSYTVTVQDLQGKVVLTQVVNDYQTNNLSLDIRGLDHGVYILKITDENGLVSVNRFSKN